jgi:hypothetical protein
MQSSEEQQYVVTWEMDDEGVNAQPYDVARVSDFASLPSVRGYNTTLTAFYQRGGGAGVLYSELRRGEWAEEQYNRQLEECGYDPAGAWE